MLAFGNTMAHNETGHRLNTSRSIDSQMGMHAQSFEDIARTMWEKLRIGLQLPVYITESPDEQK